MYDRIDKKYPFFFFSSQSHPPPPPKSQPLVLCEGFGGFEILGCVVGVRAFFRGRGVMRGTRGGGEGWGEGEERGFGGDGDVWMGRGGGRI